jgi:flagellar hook-length control protein FliK
MTIAIPMTVGGNPAASPAEPSPADTAAMESSFAVLLASLPAEGTGPQTPLPSDRSGLAQPDAGSCQSSPAAESPPDSTASAELAMTDYLLSVAPAMMLHTPTGPAMPAVPSAAPALTPSAASNQQSTTAVVPLMHPPVVTTAPASSATVPMALTAAAPTDSHRTPTATQREALHRADPTTAARQGPVAAEPPLPVPGSPSTPTPQQPVVQQLAPLHPLETDQTQPAPRTEPAEPLPRQLSGPVAALHARGDGVHRLTIALHPVELGPVNLRVQVAKDAVSLHLTTDDPSAREAIRVALPELRQQLQSAGVPDGRVTVTFGATSQPGAEQQRNQNHASSQHASAIRDQPGSPSSLIPLDARPVRRSTTALDRLL